MGDLDFNRNFYRIKEDITHLVFGLFMNDFLSELNPSQKDAAKHIDGPLLILAGAGSGKTKTITTRLAYLIKEVGIPPSNTLTLTFTNKAAYEMRERALNLIGNSLHPPLLCTFHKFGLLFLKFNIHHLGRKSNFILIDSDDKKKILKGITEELPLQLIDSEISKYKNSLIPPSEVLESAQQKNYKIIAQAYQKYEKFLNDQNMVDFDDLLVLTYRILHENAEVCKEYSERYGYIMVDEYQDTNDLQYKILSKLCANHNNICVVGDDDQSIYSWRGANIKNILEFENNFADTKIVKLEENYRSTSQILEVANALISHNRSRLKKELKSIRGEGKEVLLYESKDENEEANKIAKDIKELINSGVSPSEIAILFRLNALSRSIEEGLNRYKIPYKLVGAMRFYERAEIKDLLSYFRVILNPRDDFSLKRIINKPKRGIGKATVDKLEFEGHKHSKSIFELFDERLIGEDTIGKKNHKTIVDFFGNIATLRGVLDESPMRFLDEFDYLFGFKDSYNNTNEDIDRISNIEELYGFYRDYMMQNSELGLEDFLNEVSLRSDQDTMDEESVFAMSVHASKGLEFAHVFVVGLEEGFFPLLREGSDLEEERRLGYVAFTRAKKELVLSFVHSRFYKGKRSDLLRSRFLSECGVVKGVLKLDSCTPAGYKKGDLVKHKIFGHGRITGINGSGKDCRLKINFGGMEREILSSFVEKI